MSLTWKVKAQPQPDQYKNLLFPHKMQFLYALDL